MKIAYTGEASKVWHEANRNYLTATLDALKKKIINRDEKGNKSSKRIRPAQKILDDTLKSMLPQQPALETLSGIFGLTPFERDTLLLCAGMELDSDLASLLSDNFGNKTAHLSMSLALSVLPGAHWSAVIPDAPLRYWRLIELADGDTVTKRLLRINERILHHLIGLSYKDHSLGAMTEIFEPPYDLPPSQSALSEKAAGLLFRGNVGDAPGLIMLCGNSRADKRGIAAMIGERTGVKMFALAAGDIPLAYNDRATLARMWDREALLTGGVLVLEFDDSDTPEAVTAALSFIEDIRGPVIVSARNPLRFRNRSAFRLDVKEPTSAEQGVFWEKSLETVAPELKTDIASFTSQFSMNCKTIELATAELRQQLAGNGVESPTTGELKNMLWNSCRTQTRPLLDDLAQRIESMVTWDELVLSEPQFDVLREIAVHVRRRTTVYEEWGFARKLSRGLGISALFSGSSGTGKTMAAEVVANELKLDLYRIDLSSVVSKFIGETEKNLRRVFDAAEGGGVILLFDEADALFGKRSEVKDSHDRYANMEVSYLLQRMEAYRGLAILTTNMKSALDDAFMRRIRFMVNFPFPDASHRARIWQNIFPEDTPRNGLDMEKLAQLNVSGGNIRNIAMNAAFIAAEKKEPVSMAHIMRAALGEYSKLEKPLTDTEIRGWQ